MFFYFGLKFSAFLIYRLLIRIILSLKPVSLGFIFVHHLGLILIKSA